MLLACGTPKSTSGTPTTGEPEQVVSEGCLRPVESFPTDLVVVHNLPNIAFEADRLDDVVVVSPPAVTERTILTQKLAVTSVEIWSTSGAEFLNFLACQQDWSDEVASWREGTQLTVATRNLYEHERAAGVTGRIVVEAWTGGDLQRPGLYTVEQLGEFGDFAQTMNLDAVEALARWIDEGEDGGLARAWADRSTRSPWEQTDPFIRSLDAADLPEDVLATSVPITGSLSYAEDFSSVEFSGKESRVVLRTESGVLAAAMTNVGPFTWSSNLLPSDETISVWVTSESDLRGGRQVATFEVAAIDLGAPIDVLVTNDGAKRT